MPLAAPIGGLDSKEIFKPRIEGELSMDWRIALNEGC